MDERALRSAAVRVAEAVMPGQGELEPDSDPDWQKLRSMFETGVRATFLDLRHAIKDEDSKLTIYQLTRMMEALVALAKYMRLRNVYMKLKQVDNKLFGQE